jgi:hypothetical protein
MLRVLNPNQADSHDGNNCAENSPGNSRLLRPLFFQFFELRVTQGSLRWPDFAAVYSLFRSFEYRQATCRSAAWRAQVQAAQALALLAL